MSNRRKFWGWGLESEVLRREEIAALEGAYARHFGVDGFAALPVPKAEELLLRPARVSVPKALAEVCVTDHFERLLHCYGRSFVDSARIFQRQFSNPPDVIALPRDESDLKAVLDWCDGLRAAVIPWGGGSSVVGGVEPPESDRPVVTVDMRHFDRVLEIDNESQSACIQAGIFGPALEAQLKSSGLTLRHFPQSFEFSTLGGWIATRSGGHYATLYTHIDDFVQSLRLLTPQGVCESFRLPGSGAGPSPDRLFMGSEGIFGFITQAWMRLRPRPIYRAARSVRFGDFYQAAQCVRAISQAHLYPSNLRLLDATEAFVNGAGDGQHHVMVLNFESADRPQDLNLRRALDIASALGGQFDAHDAQAQAAQRQGAAGQWREAFLRMPYFREVLTARAIMVETFETAITWERFPEFHAQIMRETRRIVEEVTGRKAIVSCRFTHVYPDGPAPYFTFHGLGTQGQLVEQCWRVKTAVSDLLNALGGTITHHHAVGRDHRKWYDRQRPALFADALRAVKARLDPKGLMNPGVLIDT